MISLVVVIEEGLLLRGEAGQHLCVLPRLRHDPDQLLGVRLVRRGEDRVRLSRRARAPCAPYPVDIILEIGLG